MRITELGFLHPHVKLTKKDLVINSLSIARHVSGDNHPPLFPPGALSIYLDFELMKDENDEQLGPLDSMDESLIRNLMVSWYHPTPGMFLDNFLRIIREEDNRVLVDLACYFTELFTGFSSELRQNKKRIGHLPPSLIALGSLEAARQILGLPMTQWPGQVSAVCIQIFYLNSS